MSLIWNDIQAGQPADPTPINNLAHYVTQSLVEKEEGKGLSTADYTAEEKGKLAGIQAGAQVNPEIVSDFSGGTGKVASAEETKALKELIDEIPSGIDGTHQNEKIATEEGVHGFRYYNGNIQVNVDSEWVTIETGGSSNPGVPPADVSNISIEAQDGQLTICWTDPEDTYFEEIPMAIWAGTKLVRKLGSYPTSPTDGTLVVNNAERNAFATTGYVDTGLVNGTTYYYGLFPYSNTNQVNTNETNRISGAPQQFVVFGVSIDLTNTNPETAVTYTDDAVGMTPGSSAWDSAAIFKDIKPCLLKDGVVQYYLDRSDFTKKADGSAADITSGDDGDVMIEIPKIGVNINTVGDVLTVQITDNPAGSEAGFRYYAHTRTTEGDRDFIYIGAYMGYAASSMLHSLSGKTPTGYVPIPDFRTYARTKGTGYNILTFFGVTLLQCLFLIKYKNRDSQTALGKGYTASSTYHANTGTTNTLGWDYGTSSGGEQIKFLGIEDLWGNFSQFIDGIRTETNRDILLAFDTSLYNDTGVGYTDVDYGSASNITNYMARPQGTTEAGFVIKSTGGSATVHFTDWGTLNASSAFKFGGGKGQNDMAGIFSLTADNPGMHTSNSTRLTYI